MEMNQNETTTCGLYIKASGTACNSIQNAVFHGSASHNARSRSTNSQRRVIPQLTFIIALGILLKGIQVSEAAQWQPDKYCGKTGLPLGFEYEGIETNRPQIKDHKERLRCSPHTCEQPGSVGILSAISLFMFSTVNTYE